MTQHTPTIGADETGLDYRTKDNDGKKALLNHHKGSSAPSYAEAGMIWLDDAATPWVLKFYDGTDWIKLGDVNATANTFAPYNGTAGLRLLNDATDTGAADAYAVAPAPPIAAYATGQAVLLRPANASTGACTLAVNGLAAKNIKLMNGNNPSSGALATAGVHLLVYDGTNFVLLNPALGSAAYLTAGTAANNLVQLDGSAKLPAVDGSQLTNLANASYRGAVAYNSGGQSIPSSTYTALAFDSETIDTDGLHSTSANTSRMTVPSGVTKVRLIGQVGWPDTGANTNRDVRFRKNGSDITGAIARASRSTEAVDTDDFYQSLISPVLSCAAGDYFELVVRHTHASAISTYAGQTWFEMQILA